jgi:hypothetical protein
MGLAGCLTLFFLLIYFSIIAHDNEKSLHSRCHIHRI